MCTMQTGFCLGQENDASIILNAGVQPNAVMYGQTLTCTYNVSEARGGSSVNHVRAESIELVVDTLMICLLVIEEDVYNIW